MSDLTFFDKRSAMIPKRPAEKIQSLAEELERLKAEQDEAMLMAVYVGMSKEEVRQHDERRKRIYELYETLLLLKGNNAD